MHIIILVEDLKLGGVERSATNWANAWVASGHDVDLITFEAKDTQPFYDLSSRVRLIQEGDLRKSFGPIGAIFLLRNIFKRIIAEKKSSEVSVILGLLPHMCVYGRAASLGLSIKFISCVRTHPRFEFTESSAILNTLKKWAYLFSDRIVVQTQNAKKYFSERKLPEIDVIPNALSEMSTTSEVVKTYSPYILSMGRLSSEKRFDLIIRAFAKVALNFKDWTLVIVGEGQERENLLKLVQELALENRVRILEKVSDPSIYYRGAELLAMASSFEGFPNVLLEALSFGLPAIFTDCESGPSELIQEGVNGFLIPVGSTEKMSEAMRRLMEDSMLRKKMSDSGPQSVERFKWSVVKNLWEKTFREVST